MNAAIWLFISFDCDFSVEQVQRHQTGTTVKCFSPDVGRWNMTLESISYATGVLIISKPKQNIMYMNTKIQSATCLYFI